MTETRSPRGLPLFSRASTLLPGVALAFAVVGSLVAGSPAGPAAAGSSARGVVKPHHLRGEIDADDRGQRRRHPHGGEEQYGDGRVLLAHDREWQVDHPQAVTSYAEAHPEWAATHADMVAEASADLPQWFADHPVAGREYAQLHPEWAAIHAGAIAQVSMSFAAAHPKYAQEIADVLTEIEELKETDGDNADLEGDLEELAEEMIEKGAAGAYDAGPDLLDVVRDEVVAELVAAAWAPDVGDEGEGLSALADELMEEAMEEELGKEVVSRPPDGKIRMLITSGCSGSSFVTKTMRNILLAHGYAVPFGDPEIFNAGHNPMFERAAGRASKGASELEIVNDATLMLNDALGTRGEVLLCKWRADIFDQFVDRVGIENILFVGMFRENVLDRMICLNRDCHGIKDLGYPVFASNGTQADLCFARRKSAELTKAHFVSNRLDKLVERLRLEAQEIAINKEKFGGSTLEELMAFEYTDDARAVAASMDAWCALAGGFVDGGFDCGIVRDMFRSQIGSREQSLHEDVIDNYEEVFRALRAAGLGNYIRSRG